ncbi:hypothetical protein [Erysipelothrix piscisicarius]|uniref:hypothetical protein n=1 Tax=Erysipelothrix piscisicarius TaxID=2485784 RepID=UPI002F952FC0
MTRILARIYTPIVFVLALVIMLYVGITTGVAYDGIYPGSCILSHQLVPCTLVLSIPLGYLVEYRFRASKSGILIKGGEID